MSWLTVLAALIVSACAGDEPNAAAAFQCTPLLTGFEPELPRLPCVIDEGTNHRVALVDVAGRPWIEVRYTRDAFQSTPVPGLWLADLHVPGPLLDMAANGASNAGVAAGRQDLVIDESAAQSLGSSITNTDWATVRAGSWGTSGHLLVVYVGRNSAQPSEVVHRVQLSLGAPDGEQWQIATGRWSGRGLIAVPGAPQRLAVPDGHSRSLFFTPFAMGAYGDRDGSPARMEVRFRGAELWSGSFDQAEVALTGARRFVRVDIPDGAGELTVIHGGGASLCGLFEPRLESRTVALDPGATFDGRPNIVLFSADTLRADAFESQRRYAGSPTIVYPNLEALAQHSIAFEKAWSASTWTLPSHATLLASLHPAGHGARTELEVLPSEAITLAEVLRDAGYRTLAVTDGGFVASEYGLDQGFDYFDQFHGVLPDALGRAEQILESHDGRPTFLFVHSYAAHTPFSPSAQACVALGLEAKSDWGHVFADVERARSGEYIPAVLQALPQVQTLRQLYWAQVRDLDEDFGHWYGEFEQRGWKSTSALLFTSDHGESFGEQGMMFHGGLPYESEARVPLLLSGPGFAPQRRDDVAPGIDVAPTLLEIAGVAAPSSWQGRSLMKPAARDAWSFFGSESGANGSRFMVTDGRTKVLEYPATAERSFFDLVADPDELDPVRSASNDDARGLEARLDANFDAVLKRRLPVPVRREPTGLLLERLRAMGYLENW